MEASSHASAQGRLDGVRFAALVFTNLSQDHLDFHGTMDAYFEAKRRLFLAEPRPPAAVNVGDPWGARLAEELAGGPAPLLTFGLAGDADVRPSGSSSAREARASARRARARDGAARALQRRERARGGRRGAAARRLATARSRRASARVDGVPGRFEAVDEGQPFTVLVDYAHTPDALANVLARRARARATGRVLCVFGCGGDRDRGKRPLMGGIAAELADVAIVTSDNPRCEDPLAIVAEVAAGAPEGALEVEPDRRKAIRRAIELAEPGDVVVIAGKGHEQGQEIAGTVHPVRRPRGRARGAPQAGGRRRDPAPAARWFAPLGRLEPAAGATEITGVQIDSRRSSRATSSSRSARGADFADEALARGAAGGARSRRRVRRARRRSGGPSAHERRRASSASPARAARRRRRTSSPRSARPTPARSRPRGATTTSSACR